MKRTFLRASEPTPSSQDCKRREREKDIDTASANSNSDSGNAALAQPTFRPNKKPRRTSSLKPCREDQCVERQRRQGKAGTPPNSPPTSTPPFSTTETLILSLKAKAQQYRCQQSLQEARRMLEKVITLEVPGSRALMETLTELGSICFDSGDMDTSMNYHNVALNMYLDQQCETCFATLAIVNLRHVAAIYLRFRMHREALLCYNFIYKIQHTVIVDCPPIDIASTLSCMGLMNYLQEDYEEALRFYQEELRLRVHIHNGGMEQEDVAIVINSIGITWFQLEDINAARRAFQSCLQIRQQLLGDDVAPPLAGGDRSNHFCYDLAMNYFNLAAIAMKEGEDREASLLYRHSMELKRAVFGDHPEIAIDYQYLGQLFLDHGNSKAAVEYYMEAYKVVKLLAARDELQGGRAFDDGPAVSAAQKLLVIIGNIHLLEANIQEMMETFETAARMGTAGEDFVDNVRVFGCQMYSINRMHPPCAAEA